MILYFHHAFLIIAYFFALFHRIQNRNDLRNEGKDDHWTSLGFKNISQGLFRDTKPSFLFFSHFRN